MSPRIPSPSSRIHALLELPPPLALPAPLALPLALTLAMSILFSGCIDAPESPSPEPAARVIVVWDPLECGEPHRVAVELEDEDGAPSSSSTNCASGSVSLDIRHFGIYRGRIYSWSQGEIRNELPMRMAVDEPVIRWYVETPR